MPSSSSTPTSKRYHEPGMINYCSWRTWVEMLLLFNGPFHCCSDRLVISSQLLAERLYSRDTFLLLWFWPLPPHCYLKVKGYLQVCHLIFGLINFIYSDFNALFFSRYFCVDTHTCLSSYMFIVSLFLTLKLLKLHWRINKTSFLHATLYSLCLYNTIQLCSSLGTNYIVFFNVQLFVYEHNRME